MTDRDWVPLNALGRSVADHRNALDEAIRDVLDSGWFVHGPQHDAFERELADVVGAAHVVGVGNGTDALEIAIRAVMPKGRSAVVTAANCGGYTSTAAARAGFRVRYADIDPQTHCLAASTVEPVLDSSVGVVVVTHLYGRAVDVTSFRQLCESRGIAIVEDCAQAIGAIGPTGHVGAAGDVATFSFYPTKNVGGLGDGGAIATSNAETAARVRELSQYGWSAKYTIGITGGRNSRLDEMQAALLRVRLPHAGEWGATRRSIIERYESAASARIRVLPATGPDHVGHLAVVETDSRDELIEHMTLARIRTDIHYPIPDHLQPALRQQAEGVHLPVTEYMAPRILTVPCFPELAESEIERTCDALASF